MTVEQWLRVNVGDIQSIRVACVKCGGTAELGVDDLVRATAQGGECRFCGAELLPDTKVEHPANPLGKLADALAACRKLSKRMGVEFLLRQSEPRQ